MFMQVSLPFVLLLKSHEESSFLLIMSQIVNQQVFNNQAIFQKVSWMTM